MTLVMVLQVLVPALAGLLLFERWLHRSGHAVSDNTGPIPFHPELLVQWDDEREAAAPTDCTRSPAAAQMTSHGRQPTPRRTPQPT